MKQKSILENLDPQKVKVAIILSRFNDHIGKTVLENTVKHLHNPQIFRVSGALEIPFMAQKVAPEFDVVIALGVIIKGDTAHFEIVCNESARGITEVSLKTNTPIINGILTCYTEKQALERAKSKGIESAQSALEMAMTVQNTTY